MCLNMIPGFCLSPLLEGCRKAGVEIMGRSPTRGMKDLKNQYFVSVAGLVPYIEAVAEKPAAALFFRNLFIRFP